MPRHAAFPWAVAAIALAAVGPAFGYFDHFLNGTIVGTLSREQSATLVRTFMTALSEADDGSTVPLSLPAQGTGKATNVAITLLKTTTTGSQRCRKIHTELKQGSQKEGWTGWYCRQGNGEWKKKQS